ncbi:MAG: hypothetical protein HFG53_00515 [Lachnospiraceae bacterium]|jgi:hypothetical protein|nr:hypothetical protein [Lachnospiraceae bacterium]RKJ03362.1 hypothetical protein D7X87_14895 [bacterium D16-54]RKJ13706.1 hypothetical protein D7X65_15400 [bacterium D16-56]
MVALKIEELKDFTRKLFVEEVFDWWMMREAVITTFNMFTIDGRIRKGYFMEQELEEKGIGELSPWKLVRPVCFSLIKGKRLPESFRITLQLPGARVEQFLQSVQPDFKAEQVSGLYLNIRYEEQKLYCVTGTSLNVFTLDKKIEQEWDETVKRFLREREIVYTEG